MTFVLSKADALMLARLDELLLAFGNRGVALAYSGGVDSAFLKWRLQELGVRFESKKIETPILEIPEVAANSPERCYHCKRAIFQRLWAFARERNLAVVMDGTNADDVNEHRPGMRALAELGVVSPLRAVGLGKAAVRRIAAWANLPFAQAASSPCAATRFKYGTRLTRAGIERVGKAEEFLRSLFGASVDIRVRVEGATARLELSLSAIPLAREKQSQIAIHLAGLGFKTLVIDNAGYRTS